LSGGVLPVFTLSTYGGVGAWLQALTSAPDGGY
jgi:hypothetical protein